MSLITALSSRIVHAFGKALRETGQALDRVGIRGNTHAKTIKRFGDDKYIFQDHLSRHRNVMPLLRRGTPYINSSVTFVAPCSSVIGMVHIGARSSIWYGTIIRADRCFMVERFMTNFHEKLKWIYKRRKDLFNFSHGVKNTGGCISIGNDTIIRDGCVIAADYDHTIIGDGVTVGHMVNINSCIIEDNCVIGMGSVLCTESKVEKLSVLVPGTVVGKGVVVKSGEMWFGNPGRKLRNLTDAEKEKVMNQVHENNKIANTQISVMDLGGNIPDNFLNDLAAKNINFS